MKICIKRFNLIKNQLALQFKTYKVEILNLNAPSEVIFPILKLYADTSLSQVSIYRKRNLK